jgi:hypothetical protein
MACGGDEGPAARMRRAPLSSASDGRRGPHAPRRAPPEPPEAAGFPPGIYLKRTGAFWTPRTRNAT